MARTQLRLDSITGSIAAIDAAALGKGAPGSLAASDLEGVLGAFAGAVKRIHGQASGFTDQEAGRFSHAISSSVGGAGAIIFDGAATNQQIVKKGGGNLSFDVQGGGNLFQVGVNGPTRFTVAQGYTSASVDLVASGALKALAAGGVENGLLFRGLAHSVAASSNAIWDGGANALKVTGEVSASNALKSGGTLAVAGNSTLAGTLGVSGESTLASATVSDLSDGKVVLASSGGSLVTDGEISWTAGALTISGSSFSKDVTIANKLTVTGDLEVLGATVTLDVATLQVEDQTILLNKSGTTATANEAGVEIYRGSGADLAKMQWNDTAGMFEFKLGSAYDQVKVDTVRLDGVKSALFLSSSADGDIVAGTAADLVAGIGGQFAGDANISVTEAAGTITVALNMDVEIDSIKLADEAVANVGKALKVGADGLVTAAAWDEFFTVEADKGLSIAQEGFKVALSQSQDLRSSASPEFAAVEIGSAGDKLHMVGSDLVLSGAADLYFADAQGSFKLSEAAGDWSSFVTNFGNVSLVEALNSLAGGSVAGKGKWVKSVPSDIVGGAYTFVGADQIGGSAAPDLAAAGDRTEIYLNGQLMIAAADYTVSGAEVDFEFDLKADDVIVAIIR